MDPISSVSQISRLIESKLKRGKANNRAKTSQKTADITTNEPQQTNAPPQEVITEQLLALSESQRSGPKGIETLINGIFDWKFGEGASRDVLLQKSKTKIVDSITRNKKALKTTEKLIKELVTAKPSNR